MPGDNGLGIHFFERHSAICDLFARDDLQISDLCLRLGAAMRFHVANDHVCPTALAAVPLVQHGIGLARPRRRGQVDAQAAALVRVPPALWGGLRTCSWCGHGRNSQVPVTQAIATQQFLWIWASLFALPRFLGWLVSHNFLPLFPHSNY